MTTLKVNTITNAAGTGAPNIPDGVTIAGTALASINSMDYTASASEPSTPKDGAIWWDTGNDKFFQYMDDTWVEVSYTNLPPKRYGDTAVTLENGGGSRSVTMSQFSIVTGGNATYFGDNTVARNRAAAFGNNAYGLFAGGTTSTGATNVIDYVTIATAGNAVDFGDLLVASDSSAASAANTTRGVYAGGRISGDVATNVIQYVTIDTPGNSTDFGDLTVARHTFSGAGNDVYGLFGGGRGNSFVDVNTIDYVTLDTLGNATDFGDLLSNLQDNAACSNDERVLFAGGSLFGDRIVYVTIATPGNATIFGLLTNSIKSFSGTSNNTNGVFTGGFSNTGTLGSYFGIDKVVIATTGNATDFGNLTTASSNSPATTSGN